VLHAVHRARACASVVVSAIGPATKSRGNGQVMGSRAYVTLYCEAGKADADAETDAGIPT
jgi:hypothetical protein